VQKQTYSIASFIGILVMCMFNPMSIVNLIQFWWIVGLAGRVKS